MEVETKGLGRDEGLRKVRQNVSRPDLLCRNVVRERPDDANEKDRHTVKVEGGREREPDSRCWNKRHLLCCLSGPQLPDATYGSNSEFIIVLFAARPHSTSSIVHVLAYQLIRNETLRKNVRCGIHLAFPHFSN